MSIRTIGAQALRCALLVPFCVSVVLAQTPEVSQAYQYNLSRPLSEIVATSAPPVSLAPYKIPNKFQEFGNTASGAATANVQRTQGPAPIGKVLLDFDGVSDDDNAAIAGFRVVPPDTEGDVGPNHYVQWINLAAEIFDKNGASLLGPFAGNNFFTGLGGSCETSNSGDPVVLYDQLADRWLVSQFAVDASPYFICVAISQTPDPTGAYFQYAFNFGTDFPDYFKVGVWEDAYYVTARMFANGASWDGIEAIALERAQMLAGGAAQMIRFDIPGSLSNDGSLPADLDGPAPPSGSPGLFVDASGQGSSAPNLPNNINMWEFDADWTTPANSTFSPLPALIGDAVDAVVPNIPVPAPGEALDDLSHFTMHRAQFRDFGAYQTLLINHTAEVDPGRAGIRWYELRNSGGGWSIYQQGTYAPADGENRWMGSIAMNGNGDIALGYSVSSTATFPSIRFAGQSVDQSGTGTLNVTEEEIIAGGGAQTGSANRWGDYSMMAVDPSDDNAFWFTTEYYAETASFDFKTRIAKLIIEPGTGLPVELADFSLQTDETSVLLRWETDSEQNNAGFEIERRQPDVAENWESLSFIAGQGSTTEPHEYSYRVNNLDPGRHIFRLKQIDFDGASRHSPELEATLSPPNGFHLTHAYPNPFNPQSQFTLMVADDQPVRIDVSNTLGQLVDVIYDGFLEGNRTYTFTINGSGLTSGVYLYRVQGPSFSQTRTVTLMK